MSRVGRASAPHLRRLLLVPLALAACVAIAACGGSGHAKAKTAATSTPAQLVSQTVAASGAVGSGHVSLSLSLALDGIKQLGGKPISLDISGPFSRSGSALDADLAATVSAGGSTASLALDRLGTSTYLGIDGTFYTLPAGGSKTIPAHATGASGALGMLAGLGIDPRAWLTDPHDVGQADIGGVTTEHLTAQINVAAVLADVSKLIGGATGSSGATQSATSVTSLLPLLESAITSAQVDIYTGVSDHIVRRFDLAIDFTVPQIASGAIDGLTGGSLSFDATLTQLGQPQTITAPAGAQPASKLLNGVFALESRFGSLAALVASLTGGTGAGNSGSGSSAGSATASS